jgi:threonine/homoserine/homoserine lactone efflux protein
MMAQKVYLATAAAAFLYVVSPGPDFLALFTLAAAKGRKAGAWFISGHLVGDVSWGVLAFAAIIGVNQIGPVLFELLGAGCGLYLIYLGLKAVRTKKDAPPQTIGSRRPLIAGMVFGLTNPKAYLLAVAMFTAIAAPFAGQLTFADAPRLMLAAFAGFLAADMVLVFAAGLPAVRRFFLRHGAAVTRVVGVLFIAFGAKSIFDAANGAMRRPG